jgi:dihydroorotase
MRLKTYFIFAIINLFVVSAIGQNVIPRNLLIRNGHVIDPKNGIDGVMDVAISNGRLLRLLRI